MTDTNGSGTGTLGRLRKLLEYHERAATSLRHTLEMLGDEAATAKRETHATVVAKAITLDQDRRRKKTKKTKPRGFTRAGKARRVRTGAFLAALGKTRMTLAEISAIPDLGKAYARTVGSLTRHGYLKKHPDGTYSRTTVEFEP